MKRILKSLLNFLVQLGFLFKYFNRYYVLFVKEVVSLYNREFKYLKQFNLKTVNILFKKIKNQAHNIVIEKIRVETNEKLGFNFFKKLMNNKLLYVLIFPIGIYYHGYIVLRYNIPMVIYAYKQNVYFKLFLLRIFYQDVIMNLKIKISLFRIIIFCVQTIKTFIVLLNFDDIIFFFESIILTQKDKMLLVVKYILNYLDLDKRHYELIYALTLLIGKVFLGVIKFVY